MARPLKPLPVLLPCFCGRKAKLIYYSSNLYGVVHSVECSRKDCWSGPVAKSKRGAIKVWNKRGGK